MDNEGFREPPEVVEEREGWAGGGGIQRRCIRGGAEGCGNLIGPCGQEGGGDVATEPCGAGGAIVTARGDGLGKSDGSAQSGPVREGAAVNGGLAAIRPRRSEADIAEDGCGEGGGALIGDPEGKAQGLANRDAGERLAGLSGVRAAGGIG